MLGEARLHIDSDTASRKGKQMGMDGMDGVEALLSNAQPAQSSPATQDAGSRAVQCHVSMDTQHTHTRTPSAPSDAAPTTHNATQHSERGR